MNPANLPFDSEAMLQGLRGWVECESPTWDADAVERMLDIAARDMAIIGASIERIAGRQPRAGAKNHTLLSVEAIRQLRRISFTTPLPITVLFTPDEEVGTPSTRDIIEAEAARNKYVLVPEPGRANNGVVTGRYAIARFNLEATGRPSHAGANHSSCRYEIRDFVL